MHPGTLIQHNALNFSHVDGFSHSCFQTQFEEYEIKGTWSQMGRGLRGLCSSFLDGTFTWQFLLDQMETRYFKCLLSCPGFYFDPGSAPGSWFLGPAACCRLSCLSSSAQSRVFLAPRMDSEGQAPADLRARCEIHGSGLLLLQDCSHPTQVHKGHLNTTATIKNLKTVLPLANYLSESHIF